MGVPAVRQDTFRDPDVTARYVDKLDTATARAFSSVIDRPDVDFMTMLALVGAAHHADLMRVSGRNEPTYPSDVAEIIGCTARRATQLLNKLKRAGLLAGTAAAGYTMIR